METLEPRAMLNGVPAGAEHLMITELNYDPYDYALTPPFDDKEAFEFIELQNVSDETIDLTGVTISGIDPGDVSFDFTGQTITELLPNEYVVVVAREDAFEARYGDTYGTDRVAGQWEGTLGDGGDLIAVRDTDGNMILSFEYKDRGNWPGRADGDGATAELIDPVMISNITNQASRTDFLSDDDNWRSSGEFGGSPGVAGRGPNNDIVINEVLSHTDFPLSDTIELYNTTAAPIDIGGWYLADQADDDYYEKYRIPDGTIIPPHGYITFDESHFNYNGGWHPGRTGDGLPDEEHDFALSSYNGDHVWLMQTYDTGGLGFVDHVSFGAAPNGESFGRWPNATGDLVPMSRFTPGEANSGPRVGPLIISEIMYHPLEVGGIDGDESFEFIEIFNPTNQPIHLNSSENIDEPRDWRIRGDVDFEFEVGRTIAGRSTLVIVPFDPDVDTDDLNMFLARYPGVSTNQLVGGYREWDQADQEYKGLLSNNSDTIRLKNWDLPPEGEMEPGRFNADEVTYNDDPPWQNADGNGWSLHRVETDSWGIDSANWIAADPTPGMVPDFAPVATDDFYSMEVDGPPLSPTSEGVLKNDRDPNAGDTITAQLITGPSHGTLAGNAIEPNGSFTYTPATGFHGTDTFTYRATDDGGLFRDATVTITVNTKPEAVADRYWVLPGGELVIPAAEGVLLNDTDVDNDTLEARLQYVIDDDPLYGTLTLAADGSFVYKRDDLSTDMDKFYYRAFDGYEESEKRKVEIRVITNQAPTADPQDVSTDEDTPLDITLTGDDLDGDALDYVVVTDPGHGTLSGTAPNLTYTPADDYHGPDSFTFKVNDGTVDSGTVTVSISVNAVNDAPVADDDSATTEEDTPKTIDVLANDDDVDGTVDPTTVVITEQMPGDLIAVNPDGTITYTPLPDFSGQITFKYQVSDNHGLASNEGTVTIDVTPVNDPPVARADQEDTAEDESVTIDVLDNDDDPDSQINPSSVLVTQQPSSGLAQANLDGTITYTPSSGFHGDDTFTYRVSDVEGAESNKVTVTVTVHELSVTLHAEDDPDYRLDEDGTLAPQAPGILDNDTAQGVTPTIHLAEDVQNGTLELRSDGSFDYTPDPDFHGVDTFQYRLVAGTRASNKATVTITVDPVNDAPVVVNHQYDMLINDTLNIAAPGVLADITDADGDTTFTVAKVADPLHGTLTLNPDGSFIYEPTAGFDGTDSFTYVANDGQDDSNIATVLINVAESNVNPPVAENDFYTIDEDGFLDIDALGVLTNDTDADGNDLSAVPVDDVAHGTLDLQPDGSFTYTPDLGFHGTDTFTYRADDGPNESNLATVSITVVKPLDTVDFSKIVGLDPTEGDHWYRLTATRAGTLTAQLDTAVLGPNTQIKLYADLGNDQRQLLAEGDARVDHDVTFGGQPLLLQVTGLEAAADLALANLVQYLPNTNHVLVFGSSGDDTFDVTMDNSSPGLTVNGIQYVTGPRIGMTVLGGEGSDHISVTGSANNEVALLSPTMGNLGGLGYQVQWSGVTEVTVHGGGGDDAAFFYDSPGDDQFIATETYASLAGEGFENTARFFGLVHAQAVGGGVDVAKLFDSKYNDEFVSTPTYGAISGWGFHNRTWYFEAVHAYATAGGIDVAKMFDSEGDDIFHATPAEAALYQPGVYYCRAKGFEGTHAYASNGGFDTAELFDSAGDDLFHATPLFGALFGDGYYNRAKHFEKVHADASAGGNDQALLHDSESADLLEADGKWARLSNSQLDFLYEAVAFDSVKATASSSEDTKQVSDAALLDFVLELEGPWT